MKFTSIKPLSVDSGLLIIRVTIGFLMSYTHGLGKLQGYSQMSEHFYNFLGLGTHISLALVIFAEFFCSILLVLGAFTRLALVPLIITMGVAAFSALQGRPIADRESALIYLLTFLGLFFTGPGSISVDSKLGK